MRTFNQAASSSRARPLAAQRWGSDGLTAHPGAFAQGARAREMGPRCGGGVVRGAPPWPAAALLGPQRFLSHWASARSAGLRCEAAGPRRPDSGPGLPVSLVLSFPVVQSVFIALETA